MAVRTTYAAVALIVEVDAEISTDLAPFIEVASQMVTDICTDYDPAYDATKLELIERWLAAHFYAIRDQRRDMEKAETVSRSFQYKVDLALDQTIYGQQAKIIDHLGGLAALDGRVKRGKAKVTPGVMWAGTTDWDEDA